MKIGKANYSQVKTAIISSLERFLKYVDEYCSEYSWIDEDYEKYAEECFTESINDFSTVFESLGSNTISTEWLTRVEREHSLFPWMNYHIFSPKT